MAAAFSGGSNGIGPEAAYGFDYLSAYWDCSCAVNGGYHYSGELFGVTFTASPLAWDFKLADLDACPDQAPDCNLNFSVLFLTVSLGCGDDDD